MAQTNPQGGIPSLRVGTERHQFTAYDGVRYTAGRHPDSDIYLDDPRVSRDHAVLHVVDGRWVLDDLDSTNGVWLGAQRVRRLEITGSHLVRLASSADGPWIRLEVLEELTAPGTVPAPILDEQGPGHTGAYDIPPDAQLPGLAAPWGEDPPAPWDDDVPPLYPVVPDEHYRPPGYQPSVGQAAAQVQVPGSAAPPPGRYLRGQCPSTVRVSETFSVLASIVSDPRGAAALKPFYLPPGGQDVLLVLYAPGAEVLSPQRQVVRVPAAGDSEPVMFELRARAPGPLRLSITAWIGGTYLGELAIDMTVARFRIWRGEHRDVAAGIDVTPADGAVSLVVRHDPAQNAYRFEFRDEDNPAEVITHLAYQPGPRVEQLVAGLDRLAEGRAGYSAAETRDYLINAGAGLWQELVPPQLRGQFWERRDRIGQLTILADSDTVPWELLYPFDRGHDAGFLVEQFPVTRAVFGRRMSRSLNLSPAWFVLPDGSPAQAREEVSALLRLFGLQYTPEPVIGGLTPLLDLIKAGNFGLLHFACHNAFDAAGGSAISLDRRQFTPTQLNTAAIGQVLAGSAPTVFINACRSAGTVPSYHQLDGWASKFLDAGAAAFIGSLWAVRDETARQFASELYQQLRTGAALGEAAMRARMAAAGAPGDPTWLAYAVYGDPRAALR